MTRVSSPLPVLALFAGLIAYVALLTTIGRLPNIDGDEIFYKAPGREWAQTGRFAAPELTGYLDVPPAFEEVWLVYPPVYPFSFGLFVKIAGFGWRQAVFFDAFIHALLAAAT